MPPQSGRRDAVEQSKETSGSVSSHGSLVLAGDSLQNALQAVIQDPAERSLRTVAYKYFQRTGLYRPGDEYLVWLPY